MLRGVTLDELRDHAAASRPPRHDAPPSIPNTLSPPPRYRPRGPSTRRTSSLAQSTSPTRAPAPPRAPTGCATAAPRATGAPPRRHTPHTKKPAWPPRAVASHARAAPASSKKKAPHAGQPQMAAAAAGATAGRGDRARTCSRRSGRRRPPATRKRVSVTGASGSTSAARPSMRPRRCGREPSTASARSGRSGGQLKGGQ